MCVIHLEPCLLWHETERKARKEHKCSCCWRTIRVGEEYSVHFSVFEGVTDSEKCCGECDHDRHCFADVHENMMCVPSHLPELFRECISEEPESADDWQPIIDRIEVNQDAYRNRPK